MNNIKTRSWSLRFFCDHLSCLTFGSALKYRRHLIEGGRNAHAQHQPLRLTLKPRLGGDIWIRPGTSDEDTFREVFISRHYLSLARHLTKCETIVDLGANIGLSTRCLASMFPSAKIIAVEPDASNMSLLERNVGQLVSQGRVFLLRAAAWGSSKQLATTDASEDGRFDAIRVYEPPSPDCESVAGLSVRDIIGRFGFQAVDLVKMDIEGAEADVLLHGNDWIGMARSLAVEFHGDSRRASGFDELMARHGFAVDDCDAHTTIAVRSSGGRG